MRKGEEPKQGSGTGSPLSGQSRLDSERRVLGQNQARSLPNKPTREMEKPGCPDEMTSSPPANSKVSISLHTSAAAPLYDAAHSIGTLVNTAERSLSKAFTRVRKGTSAAVSQPFSMILGATPEDEDSQGGGSVHNKRPIHKAGSEQHCVEESGVSALKATKSDSNVIVDEEKPDVIMGVLSKWINIGRGWGPRLFVLEGGVLSYFRLDGPEKVSVRTETLKHQKPTLLGEDIKRLLQKEKEKETEKGRPSSSFTAGVTKPLGTIHLLVANIRASKSDDKKFYIYSGTKTLDLRAETEEDRDHWIEILEAAKRRVDTTMRVLGEMEGPSSSALVPAVREDALSRLVDRLRGAGLAEGELAEVEETMRTEVLGGLQQMLKEEQRRRWQMQNRIKELETEKAQLETAVVDQTKITRAADTAERDGEEETEADAGSGPEEDDLHTGAHGDDDDDGEDNYFEALSDFMESSASSLDASGALSQRLSSSLDMDKVGFDYPSVPRRTALPTPVEVEKIVSLWEIIKDCVGKDVSRITLPVSFNEPISTLQKCAEEMEYSWLLDRAAVYGKQGDQLMRALHVAAFALSGYACTEGRPQKPFNPLLGETYEAEYPDKGWRFVSEKMQHNPNVVACHCEGRGWTFWGDCNMKIRFWGPSMQLDPLGVLSVKFEDGEQYEWSKVTTGIYGLILGKLYIDHYGTMRITSNRNGMAVTLRFKERSIFDRNIHQVQGFAEDASGKKLATLVGKWSEHLHFVLGDPASRGSKGADLLTEAQLLWKASPRSTRAGKYKFTDWVVTLNEITPGLKEYLPPTDSRLRPDQRLLEDGRYDKSNEEKLKLEQKQRELRKTGPPFVARWFEQRGPHNTWTYKGEYWEKRAQKDWDGVQDLFALDQAKGDP